MNEIVIIKKKCEQTLCQAEHLNANSKVNKFTEIIKMPNQLNLLYTNWHQYIEC